MIGQFACDFRLSIPELKLVKGGFSGIDLINLHLQNEMLENKFDSIEIKKPIPISYNLDGIPKEISEKKKFNGCNGIVWRQMTFTELYNEGIYQIASMIDSTENEISIWNSHYPLIEDKDFHLAMERWDHKSLLVTIEKLKRHPYYLLQELDGKVNEVEFFLDRNSLKKEVNGRQDLDTIYYLSNAFLFANLSYRTDYQKAALSGRVQHYIIPETKAFSLERGKVESCCVDEVLNTPNFYQRMGNSFKMSILEEMYPECKVMTDNESIYCRD